MFAADYLARQGLILVERNFRCRLGEIDLIMRDGLTLVFIEVRLRSNRNFGGAAESIGKTKQAKLKAAAGLYLAKLSKLPECRFDAILLDKLQFSRIEWLQNIISD